MSNSVPEQYMVETIDLKKYFQAGKSMMLHAVDGVNLRIRRGQTLGVVGESGCGKSTLGRTILRLNTPTSGKILVDGEDITRWKGKDLRKMRAKMQIIFQDSYTSLDPRMTMEESIAEPLFVNRMYSSASDAYARVDELMEMVGLAPRNASLFPHEISGGLRQRVGIARALATNPSFVVCDEPVSALDVSIQAQILNLLMDLQEQMGLTYMFITHDLSVVKHISHDIAVLYLGQCVEYGSVEEIFKHPVHPYTKALLAAIPVPSLTSREREFEIIKGEVGDPINPQPGCRFASRCPYACERCKEEQKENKIGKGHYVRCWRTE